MILYLVHATHAFTMRGWLESRRSEDVAHRVRIVPYRDLAGAHALPAATYVFSDIERLTHLERKLALRVRGALEAATPRPRLLNHPARVLTRYPLLRTLHERGWNDFRAVRASEPLDDLRYPVWVREEREHSGNLTELLHTRTELDAALVRLRRPLSPYRGRELLVVEFCDTADSQGVYRKYSAFRVGERLLPRYVEHARHWMVKHHAAFHDEATIAEEARFLETNPHAGRLWELFELAGIEYGRIDYGVADGRLQVWEINTNPTVGPRPGRRRTPGDEVDPVRTAREPLKRRFHASFRAAVASLDDGGDALTEAIPLALEPSLRLRLTLERNMTAARRKWHRWLQRLRGA